jgi:hypothetical protein
MATEAEILRDANRYASKKPRRVAPGECYDYHALRWLWWYAQWVRSNRSKAKRFTLEGVHYAFVYLGRRMCVLHVRSGRVLVGEPGERP